MLKRLFLLVILSAITVSQADASVQMEQMRSRKAKKPKQEFVPSVEALDPVRRRDSQDSKTISVLTVRTAIPVGTEVGRYKAGAAKQKDVWQTDVELAVKQDLEALLKSSNYDVIEQKVSTSVFEQEDPTENSEMLLAGVVTELRYEASIKTDFWSGQPKISHCASWVKVDWELYSTMDREVVYRATTQGSYSGKDMQSLDQAVVRAAQNLLANRDFLKEMTLSERIEEDSSWEALRIQGQRPSAVAAEQQMDLIKGSVVTVRSGLRHGSGFLIDSTGYFLTNAHVVKGLDKVRVVMEDGTEVDGTVVRKHSDRDVALIKVEEELLTHSALPILTYTPQIGSTVYAIGSPASEDFKGTVSRGIVSSVREIEGKRYIQSDVSIYGGNSGGPLLDDNGNVIGITVSGLQSHGGGTLGINFFIPIDEALEALSIKL